MSGGEYGAVRARPTHFLIAVDHLEPTVDRLVSKAERFWVVETLPGEPTRIAEESAEPS